MAHPDDLRLTVTIDIPAGSAAFYPYPYDERSDIYDSAREVVRILSAAIANGEDSAVHSVMLTGASAPLRSDTGAIVGAVTFDHPNRIPDDAAAYRAVADDVRQSYPDLSDSEAIAHVVDTIGLGEIYGNDDLAAAYRRVIGANVTPESAAIREAIALGLDGESIAGIDLLLTRFPHLAP